MSDTPTSVSLSKTPAARPAPITNTDADGPRAHERGRERVVHIRRRETRWTNFFGLFYVGARGPFCYVKLGEKAGTARRAVAH